MTLGGDGIIGWRRGASLLPGLVLAACLVVLGQNAAQAQLFSDRPPPVPPASVPDPGGAVSLAPPSGPGAGPPPSLPPAAPLNAAAPGQAVLSLSAKYGKDTPAISSGLVWRVFADRPDENGT